ncbi:hypothetical protein [Paraburkholderia bonniea]|uniref:hypothetical protein n=1 Tax=Paraburkholderia bonniea TaxID=2152891 RepID=UPI001291ED30|nr:hypothetical protein [Paraburkholderia bonniea]
MASISRDTSNTSGALAPIFDRNKIEASFDITSQFVNQIGTFVNNRAKEADAATTAAHDPSLSAEQRAQAQQKASQVNAEWGPGGSYRRVITALGVAAGGNVTGSAGQFAVNATVNYVQGLAANEVKRLADGMQSESARAALHGIVGCAGAAASRQGCGAGALGASVSSVLGSLMGSTTGMSAQDRQARENLVTSLVAGIATVSGANAATTVSAGLTEVENNQVALPPPGPLVFPLGSGLPPFKLPGYRPEQAQKGDGVIADPATQLDPTIMAGALVTPAGSKLIEEIFKPVGGAVDAIAGLVDFVFTSASGNKNRLPIPDTVTADNGLRVESNPKHTLGMPGNRPSAGTEPRNSLDLFNSSIPGGEETRYAIDSNGNINRFDSDGNGVYHWSGSTGDKKAPINASAIPIEVRRKLKFKGK